jgi:uncharacterized membrane protein
MIESFKRHPFFSSAQLLAAFAAFPAFFCSVCFFAAVTPQEATRSGHPLPAGWSAGIMTGGDYYPWWTRSERPILFACSISILVIAMIILWSTLHFDRKDKLANQASAKKERELADLQHRLEFYARAGCDFGQGLRCFGLFGGERGVPAQPSDFVLSSPFVQFFLARVTTWQGFALRLLRHPPTHPACSPRSNNWLDALS